MNDKSHPLTIQRLNLGKFMTGLLFFMVHMFHQAGFAADTTPDAQLRKWSDAAGKAGDAKEGELFFSQKHGGAWSCSSCHQIPPTGMGKHASTSKPIQPLAPAFNPSAFTEESKVDKWFKRNCRDVLKRECSPKEKADVLAYLLSLKT